MSSNKVFQADVIANAFALTIALKSLEIFKGPNQGNFFLKSLEIEDVVEGGMIRKYLANFQSYQKRSLLIICKVEIWKNYHSTGGVITPTSNWRTFSATLEDELVRWMGYVGGKITWDELDQVPSLSYDALSELEPTKRYIEETATELQPFWRITESGLKTGVFCPDKKAGERVLLFDHSALARAFVKLTDPQGMLHRHSCYPNSCGICGGEKDVEGNCANYCILEDDENEV